MLKEAQESLIAALESDRTDIVRSILSACETCDIVEAGAVTLKRLLSDLCTGNGTLLHLASSACPAVKKLLEVLMNRICNGPRFKLGKPDAVRILLAAGADPGIHNQDGQTAFDLAATEKVRQVFNEELLQATAQCNEGKVCQLLAAGVNVNLSDCKQKRNTPLHWAASFGDRDIIECLCITHAKTAFLARNAHVNATNSEGATPLHDAVLRGVSSIVAELLRHGADANLAAHSGKFAGKTAKDLADELQATDLVTLLHSVDSLSINGGCDFKHASISDLDGANESPKRNRFESDFNEPHNALSATSLSNGHIYNALNHPNGFIENSRGELELSNAASGILPPIPLVTDTRLNQLWPQPQSIIQRSCQPLWPTQHLAVFISAGLDSDSVRIIHKTWRILEADFEQSNYHVHVVGHRSTDLSDNRTRIICYVNSRLLQHSESYRLTVTENQIRLLAADEAGMFYAACTVLQLLRLCGRDGNGISPIQVTDWPHAKYRAVMLDFSQGRLPKVTVLRDTINTLTKLKISQVHMYFRFHKHASNRWQFCYSQNELLELDYFAHERCCQLVPVIDVDPRTCYDDLDQMHSAFDDFITSFPSAEYVHLGPRLSSLLINQEDFDCTAIYKLLPFSSKSTMMLCSNSFHDNVHFALQLPPNFMLLLYGFEAAFDYHHVCKPLHENGVSFAVCAGTAAWNSIAGCPEAAVGNVYHAAQSVAQQGALGVVVVDWAGTGHVTHKTISWTGFVTGAGLSWNHDTHWDFVHGNLANLLNTYIAMDTESLFGQVMIELGRAETYVLRSARGQDSHDNGNLPAPNGGALYQFLSNPDSVDLENLTCDTFQKAMRHVRRCQVMLPKSHLTCRRAADLLAEIQLTTELMLLACKIGRALVNNGRTPNENTLGLRVINAGIANLTATNKTDLANKLLSLIDQYRDVWLESNMAPGLQTSLLVLNNILKQFIPGVSSAVS